MGEDVMAERLAAMEAAVEADQDRRREDAEEHLAERIDRLDEKHVPPEKRPY